MSDVFGRCCCCLSPYRFGGFDRLVKKNMPGRLFFVIAYSYCSHVAGSFLRIGGNPALTKIGSPIVGITLDLLLVEGVRSQLS